MRAEPKKTDATLLGLPVPDRGLTLACCVALFGYYLLSMHRSLSMYDSPELAMVAEQLGLGHPLGQPLHTMLGWLLTRLPWDPLWALNALSAMAGALTLVAATSLCFTLSGSSEQYRAIRAAVLAPTIAVVAMHPAIWEPSTRIEVYALAVFACMWAAAKAMHTVTTGAAKATSYAAVGVALGLGACANAICAVGTAVALTPRLLIVLYRKEAPASAVLSVITGGLLGLVPFIYVPWAASREGIVAWGRPDDKESLWRYFTNADFAHNQGITLGDFARHFGHLVAWANEQGIVALWVIGFVGYALFSRRKGLGRIFFSFSLLFFTSFVAANVVFAPDVLDYLGYLLLPSWVCACGAGLLAGAALGRSTRAGALALVAISAMALLSPPNVWSRTRHLDSVTEDIAQQFLETLPPNTIVVVESDHWVAPLWYLQTQRQARPDVVSIAFGLTASSWYWEHLYDAHPDLEPFAIRGPGGRAGRLRRFVVAQGNRPIRVETQTLATRLRRHVCPATWLLATPPHCDAIADDHDRATSYLAAQVGALQEGSPGTRGLVAALGFRRALNLQSLGRPRAALRALVASTEPGLLTVEELAVLPLTSPKAVQPPANENGTALGDPARNLHFAARIADRHGQSQLATKLRARASAWTPFSAMFGSPRVRAGSL